MYRYQYTHFHYKHLVFNLLNFFFKCWMNIYLCLQDLNCSLHCTIFYHLLLDALLLVDSHLLLIGEIEILETLVCTCSSTVHR